MQNWPSFIKNQYIDLNHSTHPIPEGFKDVEDFVFMDNDWQDILWGNSWSTQHDLKCLRRYREEFISFIIGIYV